MSVKKSSMDRKSVYPVEEILAHVGENSCNFDGDEVKMDSLRYHTFKNGLKCVKCGIEGTFFTKERHLAAVKRDGRYHFNLYGVRPNGDEVLMTKDHIVPKSKGGPDRISNLQTMCTRCNAKKGNSYDGPTSTNEVRGDC